MPFTYGTSAVNGRFASDAARWMTSSSIGLGELAGERVLLARVVRAQQGRTARQLDLDAVAEPRTGTNGIATTDGAESERPEADDDRRPQEVELTVEERCAGVAFDGCRLVVGWCATDRSADPDVVQLQPVVSAHRVRLVGQSGAMQSAEQPVTAAVAGEHAARPVRPVGCRGQPDNNDARLRIAKPGHRTSPVHLVGERRPLLERRPVPATRQAADKPDKRRFPTSHQTSRFASACATA